MVSAQNTTPVLGAIPAKTDEQVLREVSSRLRSRDRAIGFPEISRWGMTFDPRIKRVECENGIERGPQGVHRCIVVKVTIGQDAFYSDDEIALLKTRLTHFLSSRSPVNTGYRVEIAAG